MVISIEAKVEVGKIEEVVKDRVLDEERYNDGEMVGEEQLFLA